VESFRFLDLPAEMRNMVYHFAVAFNPSPYPNLQLDKYWVERERQQGGLSILEANHQLRSEALPIFFNTTSFGADMITPESLERSFLKSPFVQYALPHIRHLELDVYAGVKCCLNPAEFFSLTLHATTSERTIQCSQKNLDTTHEDTGTIMRRITDIITETNIVEDRPIITAKILQAICSMISDFRRERVLG
jgi:hypothetical protein